MYLHKDDKELLRDNVIFLSNRRKGNYEYNI